MKLINKIKCWFGFHIFYRIKKLSIHSEKIGCKNCSKEWGMHHPTKSFVEWDKDLEDGSRLNFTGSGRYDDV